MIVFLRIILKLWWSFLLITYLSISEGALINIIGILVRTICAPLFANIFLYSNGAEFIQKHIKDIIITEGKAFNLVFRYIGDALSINNPHFANCFPLIDKIKIRSTFLYQTLWQKSLLQFCHYKFSTPR